MQGRKALHLVATEQSVFFAVRAIRAAQTANQQYRDTDCHKDGQDRSARREPMDQMMHTKDTHSVRRMLLAGEPGRRAPLFVDRSTDIPASQV